MAKRVPKAKAGVASEGGRTEAVAVIKIIESLGKEGLDVPQSKVIEEAGKAGIMEPKAKEALDMLLKNGEVFYPDSATVKKVVGA
jgi:DNA replicative helicase MCM subunit Mcm2 (Cdc46/Mcm family)